MRRSAEEIVQVERLQRRCKRQYDLQHKPDGDELMETATHKSLARSEYKLSTACDEGVVAAGTADFAR